MVSIAHRVLVAVLTLAVAGIVVGSARAAEDAIEDFTLKDLDGKEVKLADLRKDKALVLDFTTTWCGWCKRLAPHLEKIKSEYKDKDLVVVKIDVKEPANKVKAQYKDYKGTVLLDEDGAVAKKYGVRGFPTVIIANKKGEVVGRGHYMPYEDLKKHVDKALAD